MTPIFVALLRMEQICFCQKNKRQADESRNLWSVLPGWIRSLPD